MEKSLRDHKIHFAQLNEIRIAYETMGCPDALPLLLISGIGNQQISWSDGFCTLLIEQGFRVIRFDNRDAGFSTKLKHLETPQLLPLIWAYLRKRSRNVAYTLEDMANDAAGLLDALGITSVHIVGGSLGGMIAQMLAIQHRSKVRTLTILHSTAFDSRISPMKPKAQTQSKPSPQDQIGDIQHTGKAGKPLRGNGFLMSDNKAKDLSASHYDQDNDTAGTSRQMAAILASSRRLRKGLPSISSPTLVIHGSDDPLLSVKHGIRTAQAIPDAKLHIIQGLGHELPPEVWPKVVELIRRLADDYDTYHNNLEKINGLSTV